MKECCVQCRGDTDYWPRLIEGYCLEAKEIEVNQIQKKISIDCKQLVHHPIKLCKMDINDRLPAHLLV
jgi:hypothetical protein